tara:strand:+ start:3409 stop:4683 length:1275 start_codon:yes stop_codon:yes gene_type:complete
MIKDSDIKIAIVGLGYVGFPLAVEFGKLFPVVGFDINLKRVNDLKKGIDETAEISSEEFLNSKYLSITNNQKDIADANFYIITVPTPIDKHKNPDLAPIYSATEMIAEFIEFGNVVVYESTVYPGLTEDECVPIIEKISGLELNKSFYVGYSPERINPGDKKHTLRSVKKITSGSNPESADLIDNIYGKIIDAGTHRVESIKVAEAAKIIENTQRDINIALINELAIIFDKMEIDTQSVLNAAGTKWNFLNFLPGLVGGHCIGVDPYYLMYKAESVGYHPEIITAGRRLNDNISSFLVTKLIKKMIKSNITIDSSRVLILGLAFKENCPDIRNTGVIKIVEELKEYNMKIDIYDPLVCKIEAQKEYDINITEYPKKSKYDVVIYAVKHDIFSEFLPKDIRNFCKDEHIIYDLKYMLGNKSDIKF